MRGKRWLSVSGVVLGSMAVVLGACSSASNDPVTYTVGEGPMSTESVTGITPRVCTQAYPATNGFTNPPSTPIATACMSGQNASQYDWNGTTCVVPASQDTCGSSDALQGTIDRITNLLTRIAGFCSDGTSIRIDPSYLPSTYLKLRGIADGNGSSSTGTGPQSNASNAAVFYNQAVIDCRNAGDAGAAGCSSAASQASAAQQADAQVVFGWLSTSSGHTAWPAALTANMIALVVNTNLQQPANTRSFFSSVSGESGIIAGLTDDVTTTNMVYTSGRVTTYTESSGSSVSVSCPSDSPGHYANVIYPSDNEATTTSTYGSGLALSSSEVTACTSTNNCSSGQTCVFGTSGTGQCTSWAIPPGAKSQDVNYRTIGFLLGSSAIVLPTCGCTPYQSTTGSWLGVSALNVAAGPSDPFPSSPPVL